MKHLYLLILLGLLAAGSAAAQPRAFAATAGSLPDSLRRVLARTPPDSSRLTLIDDLGARLYDQPVFPALMREGAALARRLGNRPAEAQFLQQQANYAIKRGELVQAAPLCQQVLRLVAAGGFYEKSYAARAELTLGDIAINEDDYATAQLHARRAVRYANRMDSTNSNQPITHGTALLLLLKTGSERARRQQTPDSLRRLLARHRPAVQRVLRQLVARHDSASFLDLTGRLAMVQGQQHALDHQPDSALHYAQRASRFFERAGSLASYVSAQGQAAALETQLGRHAAAVARVRRVLPLMRQANVPLVEADLLGTFGAALATRGEWQPAWYATQRAMDLRDSLLSQDKRRALALLETRFKTREKEARIRELGQREKLASALADRRRQQLWGVGAALAAVLAGAGVGAWLFVRLRRAQQRLEKLTLLKDQLFAIIGHDLRSPIAGFRQVVPMLYNFADQPDPAEQRELARAFDQTSAQLADLLDNLLHWGRAQTHALAARPEPVDLPALLRAETALAYPAAAAKQVAVQIEAPTALLPLLTDPTLLRVVVRNLLANAVKYTRPGGTVTLRVAVVGTGVRLSIQDTGVGMDPSILAAILSEAGPRDVRCGTAGEQGTGLGLRVARAFARELGATLSGQSAPGAGTTFTLALAGS